MSIPSLDPLLPEKDRPVLASAIQHRCQVLLTGDKNHFGRLYGQTIAGVTGANGGNPRESKGPR
ncbi:MAG: hypothetical protein NTW41_03440 [Verrucomicrobia bacterium]|nr:hypothetical protein [Verrucomicrobiota bacterium]